MGTRGWVCLVMAALCLTGCKGFWDAPSSGGGGGGGSTTLSSSYFYVLNTASNQLVGLYVNAGTLSVIPNCPSNSSCEFDLGAAPLAITVAPNNAFLYVSTLSGIFLYTVNASNGQIALANNGQPISSDPAVSMQVDSTGSWLVEGLPGTGTLFAVRIDPTTGLLASTTEVSLALPSTGFQQVAISPDNKLVLVAMGSGGTALIPFNSANGNPFGSVGTKNLVSNNSGASLSVAFDPIISPATSPRLYYIGETVAISGTSNTGGLRAFSYSTGQEISNSPFAISGNAPVSILPVSSGSYVYVASKYTSSSQTGVIAGFSVSDANNTPALTALGSTFTTGTNPVAMVEDGSGQFVFAVNVGGNPDLSGYTFDATTAGNLDLVIKGQTGTDPAQANAIAALHP